MTISNSDFVTSRGAAMFFIVAFIICLILHAILMLWKRTWFMIWFVIGCILEIVGYVQEHSGSSSQAASIIIAPIFLAASVYVSFSHIINHYELRHLIPVPPSLLSLLLFCIDLLCLAAQVAGIVLQFMSGKQNVGRALVIISFVFQIILFVFFVGTVIMVKRRVGRSPVNQVNSRFQLPSFFVLLIVISVLFFVRNVFRLIEYAQGFGYIFHHAIFTYIFDGVPILLAALGLAVFHPSLWMEMKRKTAKNKKGQSQEDESSVRRIDQSIDHRPSVDGAVV
ncbi:LADA_0E09516g1_1 [Lachancea dasiensis]|uniref:LADA_0E09516g1_1 n=1 Tax=Lachancea dasiensis TaxID=1072105 RepID=A0A1G4JE09_9SACH|nr:LADA_0E09516g1_1 [Lachancea dasiensis]